MKASGMCGTNLHQYAPEGQTQATGIR